MELVYQADSALTALIQKKRNRVLRLSLWSALGMIAVTVLQYILRPMPVRPLVFFIIVAGGMTGYVFYNQIKMLDDKLKKLMTEVGFVGDEVYFKASPIWGAPGNARAPIEIKAPRKELIIKPASFPVKSMFAANDNVLKVNYQTAQLFIVVKYFDNELESKLKAGLIQKNDL